MVNYLPGTEIRNIHSFYWFPNIINAKNYTILFSREDIVSISTVQTNIQNNFGQQWEKYPTEIGDGIEITIQAGISVQHLCRSAIRHIEM